MQHAPQRLEPHRFGQELIHPGSRAAPLVSRRVERSDRDDPSRRPRKLPARLPLLLPSSSSADAGRLNLPDSLRRLRAIHLGHRDIHQHQLKRLAAPLRRLEERHRFGAVVRLAAHGVAHGLKQQDTDLAAVGVIIHHEASQRGRATGGRIVFGLATRGQGRARWEWELRLRRREYWQLLLRCVRLRRL